jgi:hypothetical protein
VTPGTADLVIAIDGDFVNLFGGSISRSSYHATLASGLLEAFVSGSFDAPFFSGTATPTTLTLPVSFVYGVPFEVFFRLGVNAAIGFDGNADADYLASASFDHSALWGGPQDVRAQVSDGMGGTLSVALPAGSWSLTSPTFDYSEAVVVPEPGSLILLLTGLALLAARGRNRFRDRANGGSCRRWRPAAAGRRAPAPDRSEATPRPGSRRTAAAPG